MKDKQRLENAWFGRNVPEVAVSRCSKTTSLPTRIYTASHSGSIQDSSLRHAQVAASKTSCLGSTFCSPASDANLFYGIWRMGSGLFSQ